MFFKLKFFDNQNHAVKSNVLMLSVNKQTDSLIVVTEVNSIPKVNDSKVNLPWELRY